MSVAYFNSHYKDANQPWRCPSCANITSRRKGDNTPIRRLHEPCTEDSNMSCEDIAHDTSIPPLETEQGSISIHQFSNLLASKLNDLEVKLTKNFSNELHTLIDSLKKELNESTDFLFAQITLLKNELSTHRDRINSLESENSSLHSKLVQISKQHASAESSTMHSTIKQLQLQLNERDQASLLNEVEVTGIPEFDGESVTHLAVTLANKLGLSLEDRDIVSARRVGPKRRHNTSAINNNLPGIETDNDLPTRARPISVCFIRRSLRDDFLKNARIRRGTTSTDLGLPKHDVNRVHIHERLTPKNRIIFGKVRAMAKVLNWRFTWTREGRIYARCTDSSNVHIIRTEEDIERVFSAGFAHNSTT